MRLYDYRCTEGHITERAYSWDDKPDEVVCHCGAPSRSLIPRGTRAVNANVDNIDRNAAWSESAGRYFSNRADVRAYCRENDTYEISPEESEASRRALSETREARRDFDNDGFAAWAASQAAARRHARDAAHLDSYAPAREAALQDLASGGVDVNAAIEAMPEAARAPVPQDVRGVDPHGNLVMAP